MPMRLMLWYCRVSLRFLIAQAWKYEPSKGLNREAQDLLKDLTENLFPAGPPEAYK